MDCVQTIPDERYTVVQYPGYVRNADKALQRLGGEASIPTGEAGELLRLTLRPDDPYAHGLFADNSAPRKSIVLRVSRPKPTQDGMAQDGEATATVAGIVHASLQFNGLADFQYISQDNKLNNRDYSKLGPEFLPETAEPSECPQQLLLTPALFTKHDVPIDYAYKQYTFTDYRAKALRAPMISYHDPKVPPAVQPIPNNPQTQSDPPAQGSYKAVEQQLMDLLEQRSVWSHPMLAMELSNSKYMAQLLAKLTYRFKSGPWRGLNIARGYDPRTEPTSKRYQVVHYMLPAEWYEQAGMAKDGVPYLPPVPPSIHELNKLAAIPTTRTTHLQVMDIDNPTIQALCDAAPTYHSQGSQSKLASQSESDASQPLFSQLPMAVEEAAVQAGSTDSTAFACSPEYGWFSKADWQIVQKTVEQHFSALLTSANSTNQQAHGDKASAESQQEQSTVAEPREQADEQPTAVHTQANTALALLPGHDREQLPNSTTSTHGEGLAGERLATSQTSPALPQSPHMQSESVDTQPAQPAAMLAQRVEAITLTPPDVEMQDGNIEQAVGEEDTYELLEVGETVTKDVQGTGLLFGLLPENQLFTAPGLPGSLGAEVQQLLVGRELPVENNVARDMDREQLENMRTAGNEEDLEGDEDEAYDDDEGFEVFDDGDEFDLL